MALLSCLLLSGQRAEGQTVSALTCASESVIGTGTDACTATLTAAAPDGGLTVTLGSSSTDVKVPASVTVAAGETAATYTAAISAWSKKAAVTLTAAASGITKGYTIELIPPVSSLACASSSIVGSGTDVCTVTLPAAAASGGLTVTLGSSTKDVTVPASVTVPAGDTSATYTATITALSSNAAATLTASAEGVAQGYTIQLVAPALKSLTCTSGSITGAATDACTVTLTAGAASGGLTVALGSSDSAVAVPASVTVPGGSATASFSATASAVTTAQTATITGAANGANASIALQLNAYIATLSVNSSSIGFGNVDLNTPATQSLTLTSSGTAPLTVSAGSLTGSEYSQSGTSFPVTLQPKQTATLEVTFDPKATGAATGAITLTSNSSKGAVTVSLSGSGVATAYSVGLTWDAPSSSSVPVTGYDVYRAVSGGSYQLVGSSVTDTTYTDSTVADGTSYTYYVTSVDAEGNQSTASNTYTATIP